MIDLDFYTWRKPAVIDGQERLLVPMSDAFEYDFPFDFIYATITEAVEGLVEYEVEDTAVSENWRLVHYTGVTGGRLTTADKYLLDFANDV